LREGIKTRSQKGDTAILAEISEQINNFVMILTTKYDKVLIILLLENE